MGTRQGKETLGQGWAKTWDKTVWPMSQLGICTSPDSSSLEGPGRKKWHNTLIFGPRTPGFGR